MSQVIRISAGASSWQIQAAVDGAAAGTTISLSAGNYRFYDTVVIDRDDITIAGAGAGATNITIDDSMKGAPAFQVGATLFKETMSDAVTMRAAPDGARTIALSSGHGMKKGDSIWIEAANDRALFQQIGDRLWQEDKALRTALATITSVNGNEITLDRALPFAFKDEGTTVEKVDLASNVALRNFTVRGDYGTSDPASFRNTEPAARGGMAILVNTSQDAVVQGVDIDEPASHGLVIGKSIDATVTDVAVTGSHNKGDSGNGYAFWVRDVYDSSFRNLVAVDTRHAVLFASYTSAVGNDVHVRETNRDINFHGGLDHDNTVTVDRSVRTPAEQRYMAAVSFVSPGTDYGAPTDPNGNQILLRHVVGTVRADAVTAMSGGSVISTMGGDDTIIGGNGNDRLNAGSGDDAIKASRGSDTIFGGDGVDTASFDMWRSEVKVSALNGQLVVSGEHGITHLSGVEYVNLENGLYKSGALLSAAMASARVTRTAQTEDSFIFQNRGGRLSVGDDTTGTANVGTPHPESPTSDITHRSLERFWMPSEVDF